MQIHPNLQGECQANEVHHHLFIGQLHTEKTQQSEEGLIVLSTAARLLTAHVDVSVQLLAVLLVEDEKSKRIIDQGKDREGTLNLKYSTVTLQM